MQSLLVTKSTLNGSVSAPPSKSQTLRAILWASLAKGSGIIQNPIDSPDAQAMIDACRLMGASIRKSGDNLIIIGNAGLVNFPKTTIDAGNSGLVLRFITAIAALGNQAVTITGDLSICHNRPIKPLTDALMQLGASVIFCQNPSHPPLTIKGPIQSGQVDLMGADSQPVSALLIAATLLEGETTLLVSNPGETPWVELTLTWLKKLNIPVKQTHYHRYELSGKHHIASFKYTVPGDFSSMSFLLVAAIITQSTLRINHLDFDDAQGDKVIINHLSSMGANIEHDRHSISVKPSGKLYGVCLDVNDCIDALPILAVAGAYATGTTCLKNAAIARCKESDRLSAITRELRRMGADMTEDESSLTIEGGKPLVGASLDSHHDHRIAMALAVAALGAKNTTKINNTGCITKSYKHFVRDLSRLGATIKEHYGQ